jgi:hypothetical protein
MNAMFLKISGSVPQNKQKEFDQTFRFVFNQLPFECIECNLAMDVNSPGYYHFYALWQDESSLKTFMASMEFHLLVGAFKALGTINPIIEGKSQDLDLETFLITGITETKSG